MIRYFIFSSLCSGLLLLVYRLFLENEKMHRFNRLYLLLAIIFSYVVPFIVVQKTIVPNEAIKQLIHAENIITSHVQSTNAVSWQLAAIYIFWLVSASLFVRLAYNLYKFALKISTGHKRNYHNAILVLGEEGQMPHSFLHYIFIGKTAFYDSETEKEILHHELAHVSQRHSYDILFVEIIRCVLWCNPVLYFYKKSIQLNHEFLADESVINSFGNIHYYQSLLLEKISKQRTMTIASRFNFGIIKKRLVMMRKSTSRKTMVYKQLLLLPFILLSVYLFGQHIKVQILPSNEVKETKFKSTVAGTHTQKTRPLSGIKTKPGKSERKPIQLSSITTTLSPLNTKLTKLEGGLSPLGSLSTDGFESLK